jgi:plastocyanin
MKPWRTPAALACAGTLLLAAASGAGADAPKKHTVTIDGSRYEPATIVVRKGDSVTWVNKDPFPHTVTSAGNFDSRSIAANARWTWRAAKAGDFQYICTLHPNMKGSIKVE